LVTSVILNAIAGIILFQPKPTPKPVYIHITNQNYLPIYVPVPGETPDYLAELNQFRTNSFAISNYQEGYAKVRLVKRECTIPLPKQMYYKAPDNIVSIGANWGNTYYASYSRLFFTFKDISVYGGVSIGLEGVKTPFFGGVLSINF